MMKCMSYPLHIVCGQNLTIDEDVVKCLLRADPSISIKQDVNGDTPLSLLWKNTCRFRWTVSIIDGTTTYIDYIEENQSSWMTIISPLQFIRLSKLLIRASLMVLASSSDTSNDDIPHLDPDISEEDIPATDASVSIHDLCSICRLPPMIFQMSRTKEYNEVLKIVGNARTLDNEGRLPLHLAVQHRPTTFKFIPSYVPRSSRKTLIRHLIEEYPGGVFVRDNTGRLPLHYALLYGYLAEDDLLDLLRLYPDSLRIEDPITHLLPFMLVATKHLPMKLNPPVTTSTTISLPSSQENTPRPRMKVNRVDMTEVEDSSSSSMSSSQLTTDAKNGKENHWKDDHIRMTFYLLKLCPDVVHFSNSSSPSPTNNTEHGRATVIG
jgi:hypothetical protein